MNRCDPYTNIQKKRAGAVRPLCHVLEMRAAEPQQVEMRERVFSSALAGMRGATVVEVGCGTGAVLRSIASRPEVSRVIGFDPCATFIEEAEALSRGMPNCEWHVAPGSELPTGDASADLLIIWTVLIHVPRADRLPILAEARRVVRPGGRIVIADNDVAGWSCASGAHDPLSCRREPDAVPCRGGDGLSQISEAHGARVRARSPEARRASRR